MTDNRFVDLIWEDRTDSTVAWVGGGPVGTVARLQKIVTHVQDAGNTGHAQKTGGNDLIAHETTLNYQTSAATNRSLLNSLTTCSAPGGDTICLPADLFDWQGTDTIAFSDEDIGNGLSLPATDNEILPADVNNDGFGDLIILRGGDPDYSVHVLLSDGKRLTECQETMPRIKRIDHDFVKIGDFNADGAIDLVHIFADNDERVDLYLGTRGNCQFGQAVPIPTGSTENPNKVFPMDINGDGRTDLVFAYKTESNTILTPFLSTGTVVSEGWWKFGKRRKLPKNSNITKGGWQTAERSLRHEEEYRTWGAKSIFWR